MEQIRWERYPLLAKNSRSLVWLKIQVNLGLATNTIEAYGRSLEDFLRFCERSSVVPESATREHVSEYVRDLTSRPNPRGRNISSIDSVAGLRNSTLQLRLTAVRLFYDYLMEEGVRDDNPVGRGRYTPGKPFSSHRDRGLIPHFRKLPWIPNDEQWKNLLKAAQVEPPRNRLMFAMAYDTALRREELCSLHISDIDPAQRLLRIRAENTKNRNERVVPYSATTGTLFSTYLKHHRTLSREGGSLFLSESRRNRARPISIWTWSKIVKGIAARAGVNQFSTHTFRHLCLTDLARADWELHDIAKFAGHRSLETTLQYIHLSGRDLANKLENGMATIHAWRLSLIGETFR
jgi:site-specific recombinase XerD